MSFFSFFKKKVQETWAKIVSVREVVLLSETVDVVIF